MNKGIKILLKYSIAAIVGAAIVAAVLAYYGVFTGCEGLTADERYKAFCDAFFIPGLFLIFAGIIGMISGSGLFDGIIYVTVYAVKSLIPLAKTRLESYKDYKARKSGERNEEKINCRFLFIVGAVYLVVSVVFLCLYMNVSA